MRAGFQIADSGGAADIGQQDHAADFRKFVVDQRLDLGHGKRRGGEILRVAVVSQDVGAAAVHRAVTGDQDEDGVFLAGAVLQEGLEGIAHRGGSGLFVGEDDHLVRRERRRRGRWRGAG